MNNELYLRCPKCGSKKFRSEWAPHRKLRQVCGNWEGDCDWEGQPRIPERRNIPLHKTISRGGFSYEIFDRYGYIMIVSVSFSNMDRAIEELTTELEFGKTDVDAGPYTAVLWPDVVEVKGEVFS